MLEFWYLALHSPLGIVIQSSNPARTIQKLYAARRELNDPALATISVIQSPTDPSQLWLVKRDGQPTITDPPQKTYPESF